MPSRVKVCGGGVPSPQGVRSVVPRNFFFIFSGVNDAYGVFLSIFKSISLLLAVLFVNCSVTFGQN